MRVREEAGREMEEMGKTGRGENRTEIPQSVHKLIKKMTPHLDLFLRLVR